MDTMVRLVLESDGGNPRDAGDIEWRGGAYHIAPFSEDGDDNYRFHLNVRVENPSYAPRAIDVAVDWGDEAYRGDRGYLLVCRDDDRWERFDVTHEGSVARASLIVPPGTSYLSLHPRYGHGRMRRSLDALPGAILHAIVIGKTRMRRDILAVELGSGEGRPIAVYGRVHPYETIGSFMIEGMMRWLAGNTPAAVSLLANHRLLFIPMPNPDGVADGRNKLTYGGLNFSGNFRHSREPEARALKDYLEDRRPGFIFDLHGWNNRRDHMTTNCPSVGKSVYRTILADEKLFFKPVEIQYRAHVEGIADHSCSYFAQRVGAGYINSSWHHGGRSAEDFYAMGIALLRALAEAMEKTNEDERALLIEP